eukprot:Seg6752.3 transcript_id=Seg6752.3/GoldUCD/mRNA.D3Y31 product="Retrovirus-related Pol polyprotein from transposon 17.6" protein_id=Seg6752.3/GoldUCD/D3Y31
MEINVKDIPDDLLQFCDCFGDTGTLPQTHHIELKPDVTPVIHPPRRIPYALKPHLREELSRMEKLGIIEKVTEPTDWVNSLVIVHKANGKLRICIDPRDLNKAIKRQHFELPSAEELFAQMSGAKYFAKLDMSNAYWQIKIDEESSKLLTFNTPFGRYKFLRLSFGIHSASEICQQQISQVIEGIEKAANLQDDIIVWGNTREELHQSLKEVLYRVQKSGVKLNLSKCKFEVTEVSYLGHNLSEAGVKPDPNKIAAIVKMPEPEPTNKTELQRFLGMINYLGKLLPNLASVSAPLRSLLENDIEWVFDKPQRNSFNELKRLVTESPVLKFFDSNLPIRVTSDASKDGLRVVLEQSFNKNWYPVAYTSRSLTSSERNYCQLENECLSVVFACEKFNQYVYGQQFFVENDHQPLKAIFTKEIISRAPPRIQRVLLRLQRYDFTLNYRSGKDVIVADALRRAFLDDS